MIAVFINPLSKFVIVLERLPPLPTALSWVCEFTPVVPPDPPPPNDKL